MERTSITAPAHYDPPVGFDLAPDGMRAAVDFVLAHPARFVFLAVGSPRQEILAAAIRATGARPASGFASAPAWSSSPAGGRARHYGCNMQGWNGCAA